MLSFSSIYPHINLYSLFKLPLLGSEPKRTNFEYVALNANELLLPERGRSFKSSSSGISSASLCK